MLHERMRWKLDRLLLRFPRIRRPLLDFYFKILARNYSVRYFREGSSSAVVKNEQGHQIRIKTGYADCGAAGIVIRDFDNIFLTVDANHNIVDFSVPQYHTLRHSGERFFFHDICEPYSTTQSYINSATSLHGGEVVVDLGAYCGTQTVEYAKAVGQHGIVLAFEPDSVSFASLGLNVHNSGCSNIVLCDAAVSDHVGYVKFHRMGGMASSVVAAGNDSELGRATAPIEQVRCTTLEQIAVDYSLNRCDLVKMDVEGSELLILRASKGFIRRYTPHFIVEPHKINGVLNTNEIIEFFSSVNYRTAIIQQGAQTYQPLIVASPERQITAEVDIQS